MTNYFAEITWKHPCQLNKVDDETILSSVEQNKDEVVLWIFQSSDSVQQYLSLLSEKYPVNYRESSLDFQDGFLVLRCGDCFDRYRGGQYDRLYVPTEYSVDFLFKMCSRVRDTKAKKPR